MQLMQACRSAKHEPGTVWQHRAREFELSFAVRVRAISGRAENGVIFFSYARGYRFRLFVAAGVFVS